MGVQLEADDQAGIAEVLRDGVAASSDPAATDAGMRAWANRAVSSSSVAGR